MAAGSAWPPPPPPHPRAAQCRFRGAALLRATAGPLEPLCTAITGRHGMVHMQPGILFMVEKEKHLSVQAHRVQTPTYR